MALNKKGLYFTLISIAFLAVFIFIFLIPKYKQLSEKMVAVEMRVDAMNDFIKDLERDTERGLYISSYRALLALEEFIIINGVFVPDTESYFLEAVLNGTVNGTNSTLMLASTFPNWITKIKAESANFNIETNITVNSIRLYQDSPWIVKIGTNLSLQINDLTNLADWDRESYVEAEINIVSFEDPLYIVYSLGRTTSILNKTPYEGNYTHFNVQWNVTDLLSHTNNNYYTSNTAAPNFLMRFENNLSSSPNGIESLVDLKKLSDFGLEINTDSSIVDYIYWPDSGNGDYRVNFTPSWFKIDNGHRSKYNVTSISYPS